MYIVQRAFEIRFRIQPCPEYRDQLGIERLRQFHRILESVFSLSGARSAEFVRYLSNCNSSWWPVDSTQRESQINHIAWLKTIRAVRSEYSGHEGSCEGRVPDHRRRCPDEFMNGVALRHESSPARAQRPPPCDPCSSSTGRAVLRAMIYYPARLSGDQFQTDLWSPGFWWAGCLNHRAFG